MTASPPVRLPYAGEQFKDPDGKLCYAFRLDDLNRTTRLIATGDDLLHVLKILVSQEYHPHLSTLDAARKAIAKIEGVTP